MWLRIEDFEPLKITRRWVQIKIKTGEWESRETGEKSRNGKTVREVKLDSLPHDLQMKFLQIKKAEIEIETDAPEAAAESSSLTTEMKLVAALKRYEPKLRDEFLSEAVRLSEIVASYEAINPKREKIGGKLEFVAAVQQLCREAVCSNQIVLAVEPKRGKAVSPHTLDGWARKFSVDGLTVFLRSPGNPRTKHDNRKAKISAPAVEFCNTKWKTFPSARAISTRL